MVVNLEDGKHEELRQALFGASESIKNIEIPDLIEAKTQNSLIETKKECDEKLKILAETVKKELLELKRRCTKAVYKCFKK
ncbi:MAG: hypothetical protein HFE51_04930 [Clostridia bacterium]|nr:hypothetical protein [Clostridia bacterium]